MEFNIENISLTCLSQQNCLQNGLRDSLSLSRHKALVLRADEKDPSTAEGLAKGIVTNDNIILKLLCELLWGSGGVPHALSMSLGLVKLEKKKKRRISLSVTGIFVLLRVFWTGA